MQSDRSILSMSCPLSFKEYPHIVIGHGGGGRLTQHLIENLFLPVFANPLLNQAHDGAVFSLDSKKLAMSTDSYVVKPLIFPGGDIGSLAVYGTVNDLAMCGAKPLSLSASFILQEGLSIQTLWQIVKSMGHACQQSGVHIVSGDTKVIERHSPHEAGLYINTTGIGVIKSEQTISPQQIQPGDAIIVSGDIGRHGICILATRENLHFDSLVESDCAPLHRMVLHLLDAGIAISCMRDCTRGGLASALVELSQASQREILLDEAKIPIRPDVASACELFGLDPLHVANEGRFVLFVPSGQKDKTLAILRQYPQGEHAEHIGFVTDAPRTHVLAEHAYGGKRIIEMISGEQLPRIC